MEGLFALFAIAIVASIAVSYWLKAKRREAWALLAQRIGFQYSHDDLFGLERLPFELFSCGDGQGVENVAWGRHQEREVHLFEFWYYEQSTDSKGRTSRSYRHFTCATTSLDAALPRIVVKPEGLFSRLADHVGMRDFESESEEFNRAWQVEAEDRRFASYILDAQMMDWLLRARGWHFEVSGPHLLCACPRVKPGRAPLLVEALQGFRKRIPRVVWETF